MAAALNSDGGGLWQVEIIEIGLLLGYKIGPNRADRGVAHDRRSVLVYWFGCLDPDRVRRGVRGRNRSSR